VRVDRVDDAGVHLEADTDLAVDVLFDGRRIWSFWSLRDTVDGVARWPGQLRRFLDGHTELSVVEHVSGTVLYAETTQLGSKDRVIAVVDGEGRPLGIDKSDRLARTFDTRDDAHTRPLLDAAEQVLDALAEAGVDAFPAYGTLLGAVREGTFIGHDSDVDLGYVSRHTHPLDVVRESFRLQRALMEKGYPVDRYSGAAFKVDVREADGSVRGLDVFGGFFRDGRLYLLGEIGTPFEEDWIFPLGTTTLAGRELPAPARPEKLLEATYGPSWRVPDPAFHFETPRSTVRRLNGWFRGIRIFRNQWDAHYSTRRDKLPPLEPSPLALHVAEQEGTPHRVVDVGAGRGADALWFARQGVPVVALDYASGASNAVTRLAQEEGLDHETGWLNLHETRTVLAQGARLAHRGGPNTVIANHLVDATDARGLAALVRLARMATSVGGRFYADYTTTVPGQAPGPRGKDRLRGVPVAEVEAAFTAGGADIVLSTLLETGPSGARPVARLVAQWRT
jgi:hypothetical protein